MSATPFQILLFVAGTAAVALWLIGCACYAHCRGDDAMGVADTQGRPNSEDATTRSEDQSPITNPPKRGTTP